MKKFILILFCMMVFTTGCNNKLEIKETNLKHISEENRKESKKENNEEDKIKKIVKKYENEKPVKWSENIEGVVTHLDNNKEIALTLDACGGKYGSKYDRELIEFLKKENIPATLFINYRWINANKEIFMELSKNNNFQIENHGYDHRPLSVNGKLIYNIEGTKNVEEVVKEIKLNEDKIYELTGKKTKYFRAGTAYYDDVAVKIAKELGYKIAGFSINGDGGATFTTSEVISAVSKAKGADIIISHFNQPNGYTYEGLKEALVKLKKDGYKFVKLDN